jgi:hypothetical protein
MMMPLALSRISMTHHRIALTCQLFKLQTIDCSILTINQNERNGAILITANKLTSGLPLLTLRVVTD